jgi:hypothetical protein
MTDGLLFVCVCVCVCVYTVFVAAQHTSEKQVTLQN